MLAVRTCGSFVSAMRYRLVSHAMAMKDRRIHPLQSRGGTNLTAEPHPRGKIAHDSLRKIFIRHVPRRHAHSIGAQSLTDPLVRI